MGGPFPLLPVPTFSPGPRLAWGTFSLPPPHSMTRTDFLDLTLSFGRTKLLPSSPILYHLLLLPMPALLHLNSQVPRPFSISWASKKCSPPIFFNALFWFDWMVAYAALTLPHFCAEHIAVLQNPQVLDTFDAKIRHPLLNGQLEVVAAHFIALLPPPSSTHLHYF